MSDIGTKSPVQLNERTHRSSSAKFNAGTMAKQLIIEQCNSAENWYPITEAFKSGRARDISDEPKVDKIPAFVIGSGPSLDKSIKYLKQWDGGIFCSTSHALTLMYYGIEPTHLICLDPFSSWKDIKGVDWSKTRTKLVLHPGIDTEMVRMWPNDFLFYIQGNGESDSWYENEQKKMYTWRDGPERSPTWHYRIRTTITIFACSPPMQLFCADKLGFSTIFLAGCDFGFPDGKERFTEYTPDPDSPPDKLNWIEHAHPWKESDGNMQTNAGIPTHEIHCYYKKNHISSWRLSHQQMYTTDHGCMPEVPFTDIRKVIQKKGRNYPTQSHAMIDRITERYLCSVGAYVIVANEGVSFVESERPELDLPAYMSGIHGKYNCAECKLQFVINADTDIVKAWIEKNKDAQVVEPLVLPDHAGEECPNCHKGKLTHENIISIERNMERINGLIRFNRARENEAEHKEEIRKENVIE